MKRWLPTAVLILAVIGGLAVAFAFHNDPPARAAAAPSPAPGSSPASVARPAPSPEPSTRATTLAPRSARSPSSAPSSSPTPRLVIYAVQAGDSLSAIAWKVHVPVEALYLWNLIVVGPWPDRIYPGQPLIIGKVAT